MDYIDRLAGRGMAGAAQCQHCVARGHRSSAALGVLTRLCIHTPLAGMSPASLLKFTDLGELAGGQ